MKKERTIDIKARELQIIFYQKKKNTNYQERLKRDQNIARLSQAVTYFHSPKETPQKIKKLLLMKNKLQRPKTIFFITPTWH